VVLELLRDDDPEVVVSLGEASMVPFTMQEAYAMGSIPMRSK
jgi:hypothetical protein